jgi:hypothetical protein
MAKKENKQIVFEIPANRVEHLDRLIEKCGLDTRKDLINNALALFDWAVSETESGKIITSLDESSSNYQQIVLPALKNIESTKNAVHNEMDENLIASRSGLKPITAT